MAFAVCFDEVAGQNCTGSLPTEIAQLPYLQAIALYHNEFAGTLPQVYAEMKQLVSLELHYNALTGPIPDSYWRADSLQVCVCYTWFICVVVDVLLVSYTCLQHLNVGSNVLTGTLRPLWEFVASTLYILF